MESATSRLLTVEEFAHRIGRSKRQVHRYIAKSLIMTQDVRGLARNSVRIPESEIARFLGYDQPTMQVPRHSDETPGSDTGRHASDRMGHSSDIQGHRSTVRSLLADPNTCSNGTGQPADDQGMPQGDTRDPHDAHGLGRHPLEVSLYDTARHERDIAETQSDTPRHTSDIQATPEDIKSHQGPSESHNVTSLSETVLLALRLLEEERERTTASEMENRRLERENLGFRFELQKYRLALEENAASLVEREARAREAEARLVETDQVAARNLEMARLLEEEQAMRTALEVRLAELDATRLTLQADLEELRQRADAAQREAESRTRTQDQEAAQRQVGEGEGAKTAPRPWWRRLLGL